MRTDTHFQMIFLQHPAWIFQLAGKADPGPCEIDSVHFKQLMVSPDSRITPKDPARPLFVVEFQFINGGDNIHARTALSMNLAQRHYHSANADPDIVKAGLRGELRTVCGIIFLGKGVKSPAANPWEKVVEVYDFENVVNAFAKTHPDHPVGHLFFPLLEPDAEKVEREALAHYRALAECKSRGDIGPDIMRVFAEWLNQRHTTKTWKDISMILLEDLAPLEETVSGRELVEKGKEIGKEIGKEEGERGLLLQQLTAKFGPLPEAVKESYDQLSYGKAKELALDFLIMSNIGELVHWFETKGRKSEG